MATPPSINLVAQQTVTSDIGDYADRNDIIELLNVDLAPYMSNGVQCHRYRIEVSLNISFHELAFGALRCDVQGCESTRQWLIDADPADGLPSSLGTTGGDKGSSRLAVAV